MDLATLKENRLKNKVEFMNHDTPSSQKVQEFYQAAMVEVRYYWHKVVHNFVFCKQERRAVYLVGWIHKWCGVVMMLPPLPLVIMPEYAIPRKHAAFAIVGPSCIGLLFIWWGVLVMRSLRPDPLHRDEEMFAEQRRGIALLTRMMRLSLLDIVFCYLCAAYFFPLSMAIAARVLPLEKNNYDYNWLYHLMQDLYPPLFWLGLCVMPLAVCAGYEARELLHHEIRSYVPPNRVVDVLPTEEIEAWGLL
jgi:hypothetical protein